MVFLERAVTAIILLCVSCSHVYSWDWLGGAVLQLAALCLQVEIPRIPVQVQLCCCFSCCSRVHCSAAIHHCSLLGKEWRK